MKENRPEPRRWDHIKSIGRR